MARQTDWDQLLLASEDLVLRVSASHGEPAAFEWTSTGSCIHLHKSTSTLMLSWAVQEGQGFPRVERDVLQVEQFSQKLRAKATRVDATSEALDASRLLAQEGLNPRRQEGVWAPSVFSLRGWCAGCLSVASYNPDISLATFGQRAVTSVSATLLLLLF